VNTIHIRPALPAEQKTLEALQWRASLNNPGDREALLAHPDAIQLPPAQIAAGGVFLAECNGTIVGFSAILPRPDGETELDGLFVEPGLWRSGIGRSLVEHCASVARMRGSGALHVIGNPHAQAFYEACGFQILGSTQMLFGRGLLLRRML
jgi:GNAT superfamily N-acetyltransferase